MVGSGKPQVPVRKFLSDLDQNIAVPGKQMGPSSADENSELLKLKNINIILIAFTTFLTIIFLQILA
jgi:hypothetical protein